MVCFFVCTFLPYDNYYTGWRELSFLLYFSSYFVIFMSLCVLAIDGPRIFCTDEMVGREKVKERKLDGKGTIKKVATARV